MKKTFTNKKIEEGLYKPTKMNFAVVLDDGTLYIHEHGQIMCADVYHNRDAFCDVSNYVSYYASRMYNKRDTARMIREAAENYYAETYDYFDGERWIEVNKEWLDGVNLNGLTDVYRINGNKIKCVYEDGREVYYENIFGTWGNPTVFQ